MIQRSLRAPDNSSCFLFGPRQTGKSTLVTSWLKPGDLLISLLPQREFLAYSRDPGRFRDEILAHARTHPEFTCVVDEIQRIPDLLNEVHDLIETRKIRFILTGSSARKLRRGGANLLAGRALSFQLFPCTETELGETFDLERALRLGTLPKVWASPMRDEEAQEFLRSYCETYLKEEIQQEGIVRQIGPFSRFLEIAAVNDGQIVNYSTIARDCGVSVKTAQQYYQILEDTFLAHRIDPLTSSARKRLVAHPKFYFFDPGVTNSLCQLDSAGLNSADRGRRFEQWCILQILSRIHYDKLRLQPAFWRTHTGTEVDLILTRHHQPVAAVEFKSNPSVSSADYRSLKSFREDHPDVPGFLVVPDAGGSVRRRQLDHQIELVNWRDFLRTDLSRLNR